MMTKEDYLRNPDKLLAKRPFTRGVNEESIAIYSSSTLSEDSLLAEIPSFRGRPISQTQYMLELDPNSHAIMFNDDLPRLSSDPNASWDMANPYRASFAFQAQILEQHNQYVNANGMKFTLLNRKASDKIHETFIDIKEEWVSRNMDILKSQIYLEQKSVGDAAILFYFNRKNVMGTRLMSYRGGYTLVPQYDQNGEMILFSFHYQSGKKRVIDTYDEKFIYKFEQNDKGEYIQIGDSVAHGFDDIPVVYKRGQVAWEEGQVLIDIYELLYNIYMIIEKKVGFPLLYIIGRPVLEKKKDTAAIIVDSSVGDMKSDAKFLNPQEPAGFQNLLADMFKKIQICTSSILLSADEVKITADISGVAIKLLRSAVYQKATKDIELYDEVADKMFALFKDGVSKELGVFSAWNKCKVRAEYHVWNPQSETEFTNRLVVQKQSGIISAETATELSPDSQPDEKERIARQVKELAEAMVVEPIVTAVEEKEIDSTVIEPTQKKGE